MKVIPVPVHCGLLLVMTPGVAGEGNTVKLALLTAVPPGVVTETVPVVPLPTVTVRLVAVVAVTMAGLPPMATAVAPARKLPLIVREVPSHPLLEPKLVMLGWKVVSFILKSSTPKYLGLALDETFKPK